MGFFLPLLVMIFVQFLCNMVFGLFIPNVYLIRLLSNIIVSFIFGIMVTPFDRKHFYKNVFFHKAFTSTLSIFTGLDLVFGFLGM